MKADDWSYTPFRYGSYTKGPYRLIVKGASVDLYDNGKFVCTYGSLEGAVADVELNNSDWFVNKDSQDDNHNLNEDNI